MLPQPFQGAGNWGSNYPNFNGRDALNAGGSIISGMFGNSGQPFQAGMDEYQKWANQAQGAQQPYLQAGQQGLGQYQNMLGKMQDPSAFMNNLMGQYQPSAYNQYLQNQTQRMGVNAASANGMMGSTPYLKQAQQNAANIGQQGMNDWLQQVLGINSQALGGYGNMAQMGQGSANALTNMYAQMAPNMASAATGRDQAGGFDWSNMLGGGLSLLGMFL